MLVLKSPNFDAANIMWYTVDLLAYFTEITEFMDNSFRNHALLATCTLDIW